MYISIHNTKRVEANLEKGTLSSGEGFYYLKLRFFNDDDERYDELALFTNDSVMADKLKRIATILNE